MELKQELHDLLVRVQPVDLLQYRDLFEEFKKLETCQQSPDYHAEGNVLIHTQMATAEAYKLCQVIENPNERLNLYLGTFLHDWGKPDSTFVKPNGRIVAYGHEQVGVTFAREFLRRYFPEFGFARREYILSLVEFHGHPKQMVTDKADDNRFKQLSFEVNPRLVHDLEVADYLGRIGTRMDEALDVLKVFKERAQGLGVWDRYYQVPGCEQFNNLVYSIIRWNILSGRLKEGNQAAMEGIQRMAAKKTPCELMLTVGVAGSGKSSYLSSIYPHIPRISMDETRLQLCGSITDQSKNDEVFRRCFARLGEMLNARQSVIWDATNLSRKRRRVLIDRARQQGAYVSIVYFDISTGEILRRNASRERQVPEHVILDQLKRLQAVKSYECDELRVVEDHTPRGS